MFKYATHYTTQISDTKSAFINAKDCFKVVIQNDSPGTILVNKCPIESGETKNFDGLPPGVVFAKDFDLDTKNTEDAVEIYVTRYFYTNDPVNCKPESNIC